MRVKFLPPARLVLGMTAVVTVIPLAFAAAGPAAAAPTAAPTNPAPVQILTSGNDRSGGDFFITPTGDANTYAPGAEIVNREGQEVWFHPAAAGKVDADFRVQRYDGQRVLTFWEGTGFGGLSSGTDYIYNTNFQQIATVNAGNGFSADGHEFAITPWNTALVLSYTTAQADLTSIGGPANQTVVDGIVQEINISTGQVLFQWNSADHVPYGQSEQPLPASASTPWDWFHINAVKVTRDDNLLIDARDAWTTYKVSLATGNIIWQLGGKDSSFTLKTAPGQTLDNAGEFFAWQHDPEQVGPNEYTFFDNESAGTPELASSRAIEVKINQRKKTATLIKSWNQPEGQVAASQGDAQTIGHDNLVVGWGALPFFSEFSKSGALLFNAEFPVGVNTYRAYRFQWPGDNNSKPH
ncbi:MAG TPA: arylsulfotransferase family protein [Streptosporangiaceae bacterium]|jgi:hypothetical protein